MPVIAFALIAAVLGGLVFFHRPPDEDLLRQAADRYVSSLGPVKQFELHGNVADIVTDGGRLVYAEFEKQDGTWTYARNLAEEFSKAVKEPEVQNTVRKHLGERIAQRFQSSVKFSDEFGEFRYELARDLTNDELVGSCTVHFSYPKIGERQQKGKYVETFEWKDRKWQSVGPGSLYDSVR